MQSAKAMWLIHSEVFDKPVKAIVSRKAESSDPYTGTFSIDLTLTSASKAPVASGMFGKAEIHPVKKSDSWTIPYAALLDGDASEGFVFVTDDGKTVQKIPVQIAAVQHHSVVISGGLENHKQLVVSGSAYLNEASIIRIRR
jgi:hypothetical protein